MSQIEETQAESKYAYDHNAVETAWMYKWVQDGLYTASDTSLKPTYYIVDMYPYPSGEGLHVGHVEGYTATDIIARYMRMNGYEVLHPMGYDSMGKPTEEYAMRHNKNPHEVTAANIEVFREQCIRMGFSIDWTREIDTSQPEYYKWTQQLFIALYEQGLAYKKEAPVNWCGTCNSTLANEDVKKNGCCERCDSEVTKKNIEQWYFKITDFAEELLHGLDELDWPESTKEAQRNWIGKKEGWTIPLETTTRTELSIFTSEPEIMYHQPIMYMAPEHAAAIEICTPETMEAVNAYRDVALLKKELQRKQQGEFTSVFTGSYATNPLTGEPIPIYISDSILMDETSGIRLVVPEGDYQGDLSAREQAVSDLGDLAKETVTYKLRDWLISRERYWGAPIPIIHCEDCGDVTVPLDQLPVELPHMEDFKPTGQAPLSRVEEFVNTPCPCCGKPATRETKTHDTFVESAWYYFRYVDPHNADAFANKALIERWLPVDYYMGGADHATGHLLFARFITKFLHKNELIPFDEPFTHLEHQGMILGADGRKMSKRLNNGVNPLDVAKKYGADAIRLYEMFMGPIKDAKVWNDKGLKGPRKLLDEIWKLYSRVESTEPDSEEDIRMNQLILQITDRIDERQFNTAISDFMKYINAYKGKTISKKTYETFLTLMAPFAPFITEALWSKLEHDTSIHLERWPTAIEMEAPTKNINMLFNGRFASEILDFTPDSTPEEIQKLLEADDDFKALSGGRKIKRVIYKQGVILNVILE